ncbi:hypothetical protein ACXJK9_004134 [Yersinia enterocolitica]
MTNEIKTGGPAFPQSGVISGAGDVWMSSELGGAGLTVRDYFAAKALLGWLAGYPETSSHPVVAGNEDKVAKEAYQMADAMIKARG